MNKVKQERTQAQVEHSQVETYPNGGMTGKLYADLTLLPSFDCIFHAAKVMTQNTVEHGGRYERDNWKRLSSNVCYNHALTHLVESLEAQEYDDKVEHLAHALCRIMMCYYILSNEDK